MPESPFIWPPGNPGPDGARSGEHAASSARASSRATENPGPSSERSGATPARVLAAVEHEFLDLISPLAARLAGAEVASGAGAREQERVDVGGGLSACWRCGRSIGPFESDAGGCGWCRGMRLPWAGTVRLGAYDGVWAQVVREVKYARFAQLGHEAGERLGMAMAQRLADAGVEAGSVVVVPVPTHWRRRFVRGIDHAEVIAAGVAAGLSKALKPTARPEPREIGETRQGVGGRTKVPIVKALWRLARPSQTSLPASERRRSLGRTMGMLPARWWRRGAGWRLLASEKPLTVVLIDDVTTTGATMREACRALGEGLRLGSARKSFQVFVGVIAVTDERKDGGP
jgi:predicted amidophosphoribosyltransferase